MYIILLGLTAAASATDAAIHGKMFGSGNMTLIIYNEEMNDIMKIVKSSEKCVFLTKGIYETIENEAKTQKGGFLRMLLGTLGASFLGNLLTGKRVIATSQVCKANMPGWGTIRAGEGIFRASKGTVRASQDF